MTRLSHTLEVAQIARTIARALNLNEDLTEAIALGHDLGHTPFGHIGEEELNKLYPAGFRHYEQSLRVVDYLENEGRGLNLTREVRHGIRHHSKGQVNVLDWSSTGILEADICKLADMVAYVNHDTGDAIRGHVVSEADMPATAREVLGPTTASRVNTMVSDIIASSWAATGKTGDTDPHIRMGRSTAEATNLMRNFLYERVYEPTGQSREASKARGAVYLLYRYYCTHSEELPREFAARNTDRRVVDYIAGMTDQFATTIAAGIKHNTRMSSYSK